MEHLETDREAQEKQVEDHVVIARSQVEEQIDSEDGKCFYEMFDFNNAEFAKDQKLQEFVGGDKDDHYEVEEYPEVEAVGKLEEERGEVYGRLEGGNGRVGEKAHRES